MEKKRHRYVLDFPVAHSLVADTRNILKPAASDSTNLALLMLNAYQDTIDSDDETFKDALEEVQNFFNSHPLLDHSAMLAGEDSFIAACLVSYLEKHGEPLIAYIMTRRESKREGLARVLLGMVLSSLESSGYKRVRAVITEGNVASERLFVSYGFKRVGI